MRSAENKPSKKVMIKAASVLRAAFALASLLSLPTLPAAWGDADARFPAVPESSWVGLRFMILPQSKAVQHYGYQPLYQGSGNNFGPLPYAQFAGRTFRVVNIGHANGPAGEELDEADLQLEGDNKIIHGDIDHGCMADVCPVSDLEAARKLYLGKTLWLTRDHLSTYDAQKDTSDLPASPAWHQAFQAIRIKPYSAVKVVDIVPGWYASSPIRFVVQEEAQGQEPGSESVQGYVDVHMSGTNIPKNLQAVDRFESAFLEADPRKSYNWPPKIWAALENKEILLGMTAQQVRMSWGEPTEVHKLPGQNIEEWSYDPAYLLTLKDGTVNTVSRLPALSR